MSREPRLAVLHGGVSPEREVSLGSGRAVAAAFRGIHDEVDLMDVVEPRLPAELDPENHVVFSTLHGVFGEDGQAQRLLEEAGIAYAGCNATSSALTFDKVATKRLLAANGVPVLEDIAFERSALPAAASVIDALGEELVVKPRAQGSSVGLAFASGVEELGSVFDELQFDAWLVEPKLDGREFTVGILGDAILEVVEIRPKSGAFDYTSKYTKGRTDYLVPAPISEELSDSLKHLSKKSYDLCGCRDYARVDLMTDKEGTPFVLEINTLPGFKETSLLPMSAAAAGYNFEQLLELLIEPAKIRYQEKYSLC